MRARTAGRRRRDFCERAEWSVCRRGDLFLPRARAKVVPGAMSHTARRPLEVPPFVAVTVSPSQQFNTAAV